MAYPASPAKRQALPPLALRIFLWGAGGLLLLFCAGLVSLYLICVYKPDMVNGLVQGQLLQATGMPWRIAGAIRPVLTPFPGLAVSDLRLVAASPEQLPLADPERPLAHVPKLHLYADMASLAAGAPRFRLIELFAPVIHLAYDGQKRPLWLPFSPAAAAAAQSEESAETLALAAGMLRSLPVQRLPSIHIRDGSLSSYAQDGDLFLSFSGVEAQFDPAANEDNLRLAAAFSLPDAGLALRLGLSARLGDDTAPLQGRLEGQVAMRPPGSRALTGSFTSGFRWQRDGRHLLLPDFHMLAETDAIRADLVADLALPECRGKVQIDKLSLPRWFSFGRAVPPGVGQALDGLTGAFDLQFDKKRAEARNLRGIAGELAVSGYVGTPDFSAPVVVVDLDVGEADLDHIFPFLALAGDIVPDPASPLFDHPPLVPYPGPPSSPPGPDVGYDVTIRVARPKVHGVESGPAQVLVFPATLKGVEKTRVAFTSPSIMEGSLEGRLDIDERAILMHYAPKDMELRLLPENIGNVAFVAGKVSGVCEIDVPMLPDGALADDWKIRINAAIKDCDISESKTKNPVRFFAGTVKAEGEGAIYAVPSRGIRLEGLWKLAANGVKSSWFPKGDDSLKGLFTGGLFWPPFDDTPQEHSKNPPAPQKPRLIEKRGVNKVAGTLHLEGSLMTPFGSLVKPVTGKLDLHMDWRPYERSLALQHAAYEGFASTFKGDAKFDFSGKGVSAASDLSFIINPQALCKGWKLEPPEPLRLPAHLAGKCLISGTMGRLHFDKLKAELDGAPLTGEISWQAEADPKSPDSGLWTVRLFGDLLDLDKYFPLDPPAGKAAPKASQKPWNLSWAQGTAINAQAAFSNLKKDRLTFGQNTLTAAMQRGRFSLHAESAAFYGGKAVFVLQGTALPAQSQLVLREGLVQIEKADIGKIVYDYSKENHYGGTASLLVDAAGSLNCDADLPAKLSGVWNMHIVDGLYPAFLGGETPTQSNSFSLASAGGALDKGVLRSDNFKLSGAVVDMAGGGWFDLGSKDYDVGVSVTFAKIPTVPVRFYGSTHAPRMSVRGVDMVVETVQNAGSTVFGLVKGVLLLPVYAVRGISSLVDTPDAPAAKKPQRTMPLAPGR